MIRAAVVGASGYAGGEVLRILANHPNVVVATVTAHSQVGALMGDVHPHLRSLRSLRFQPTVLEFITGHDVVFFALPHGTSAELTTALAKAEPDTLLIDCGADHRLHNEADWESFYGTEFSEPWTYGVPELPVAGGKQRQNLIGTKRIAAPGCNASTVALGLAPGIASGLIDASDLTATLVVGPSGAGRSLKPHLLASELLGNARPYSVAGAHRHIPEIKQSLGWAADSAGGKLGEYNLSFTPVLVPIARGILAVISAPISPEVTEQQVMDAWNGAYQDEEFVQVLSFGSMPQVSDVIGANTALIGLSLDRAAGRLLICAAVDNLVKGTAGAAIQSMNLALALEESSGLTTNGVAP